jgi:hypothetical protein
MWTSWTGWAVEHCWHTVDGSQSLHQLLAEPSIVTSLSMNVFKAVCFTHILHMMKLHLVLPDASHAVYN